MSITCKRATIVPVILLILAMTVIPVHAMKNPSAIYCTAMGYSYETVREPAGEYGVCRMPDHRYVDSWEFLRGREGQQFNYCALKGYSSKTSKDAKTCSAIADAVCTVCVLPDKSEKEVTTLMGLSFAETTCGDGMCVITETYESCPADCPQSGNDGICQRISDFKCDPDCIGGKGDPDCMVLGNPLMTVLIILVILGIIAGVGWVTLKKRKHS